MAWRYSSLTISSVSSSWFRRKSAHWQLSGIGGVRLMMSTTGSTSSRRSAMKIRGMSGK